MNKRALLYGMSAAVLAFGSISSAAIYWSAATSEEQDYEIIGGFIYPGGGASSKKYVHDLQLYGGKAAVLADDFMRWFSGLWHGTQLAYTVAVLSILASLTLFLVGRSMQPRPPVPPRAV